MLLISIIVYFLCYNDLSCSDSACFIEESRTFKGTLNFKISRNGSHLDIDQWIRSHVSCIKFLGDFLLQTTGSPTNVAIAQVGYILSDGTTKEFPIKKFFTSKMSLKMKSNGVEISDTTIGEHLKIKNGCSYKTFPAVTTSSYAGHSLTLCSKYKKYGDFCNYVRQVMTCSATSRLSASRLAERVEEIEEKRMDFFLHGEQAMVLCLLEEESLLNTVFDEEFFSKDREIKTFFVSTLSYFDPCMRCGDTMLRASEGIIKERLESFFSTKKGKVVTMKTGIFLEVGGILPYSDPLLDGSRLKPLRLSLLSKDKKPLLCEDIVPRVCCSVTEE